MFDWLKSKSQPIEVVDDKTLNLQIEEYSKEVCFEKKGCYSSYPQYKVKESVNGKAILESPEKQQITILFHTLKSYIRKHQNNITGISHAYSAIDSCQAEALQQLMTQLMRRKLPYKEQDLIALLQLANDNWKAFTWYRPHNALLGVLERTYKDQKLPDAIAQEVKRTIKLNQATMGNSAEDQKLVERGKSLLGEGSQTKLVDDCDWSRTILKDLQSQDDSLKQNWQDMLAYAQTDRKSVV